MSGHNDGIILGYRNATLLPNNKTIDQQATISGINSKTGEEFNITCSDDIAPLIEKLNAGGVETFCHDQDDNDKTTTNNQLHLTIKVESFVQLAFAVKIIKKFWSPKFMSVMLNDCGKITIRTFKDQQQFIQAAESISINSIGF